MLKLFDRYILREVSPPFFLGLAAYSFVLLMNQIMLLSEMFIARGVALRDVLSLLFYLVPGVMAFTVPMSVLMGILAGLSRMSADSEITAFRTLGVGNRRLLRPILIFSFSGLLLTAFLTLFLAPRANYKWVQTLASSVLSRVQFRIIPREFNQTLPHTVIYVQDIPLDRTWRNVFVSYAPPGKDPRIIFARSGHVNFHQEEKRATLELFQGAAHSYPPSNPDQYIVTSFDRWEEEMDVTGLFTDSAGEKHVREKDIGELLNDIPLIEEDISRLEETGIEPGLLTFRRREWLSHWVEVHKKFALPCACLIFALVGIPLGASSRKGGRTGGFTLSIVIIVIYYILITAGENLAKDERIAPWLGMWGPNMLLFAGGLILFLLSQRESIGSVFLLRRRRSTVAVGPSSARTVGRTRFSIRFPNILDRYVIRKFVVIFVLAFLSLLVIFVIITFFEQIDTVYRHNKSIAMLMDFIWLKLPEFVIMALPMTALASALLSLGIMTKFNEITAVKTCGISLYRITFPLVMLAGLLCFGAFYLQENVLPYSNQKAEDVMGRITDRPPRSSGRFERRWIMSRSRDRIYHYRDFNPIASEFLQLSIYDLDTQGWSFRKRTFSEKASLNRNRLDMTNGWEMDFAAAFPTRFERQTEMSLVLEEDQSYFQREWKIPNQMRYGELDRYIRDIEERGFDTLRFKVDLKSKLSFPMASLIMILLGIPFAFTMGKRGTLVGIGLSIVIGMVYWGAIGVFKAMGYAGYLNVFLAAWGPNLIFGLLGIFLILKVRT